MNQRQLRKTLAGFYSKKFDSGSELLTHVVQQIVQHGGFEITGGRVWRLRTATFSYELVSQAGSVNKIREQYRIRADRYTMFKRLPAQRTMVLKETDRYLRRRGILRYSATGVGDIVKIRNTRFYQYILSFNTTLSEEQIAPTLDIISIVASNMLTSLRNERRSTQYKKDLDKAREIQQSILPDRAMRFHHYEIYGLSVPDKIVGGDFFDYIETEDGDRLSIAIGDAASKGMVSAVQALYVSGAIRMGIGFQTKLISLVHRINLLTHRMFPSERFVTLVIAELTTDAKGICLYINAGHPRPILFHAESRDCEFLESTGTIIGPFPEQVFRRESAILSKGDILLLYTDGLMEAMDAEGNQYTEKQLGEDLEALHSRSAEEIAHAIIERVQEFGVKGKNQDDKTIVVVKRLRSSTDTSP